MTAQLSPDAAYAASARRDTAMDGRFVLAVVTTGIYCKPSCPARMPKRANARFYLTAAAAEARGRRRGRFGAARICAGAEAVMVMACLLEKRE